MGYGMNKAETGMIIIGSGMTIAETGMIIRKSGMIIAETGMISSKFQKTASPMKCTSSILITSPRSYLNLCPFPHRTQQIRVKASPNSGPTTEKSARTPARFIN
jgi:hypothetical protein